MSILFAFVAFSAFCLLVLVISLIVGLDLVAVFVSIVLPYAICAMIAFPVVWIICKIVNENLDTSVVGIISLIVGIIIFVIYLNIPRYRFKFKADDIYAVGFYNYNTKQLSDVVERDDRVEELADIITGIQTSPIRKIYVPGYVKFGQDEADVLYYLGIFNYEGSKIAEVKLSDDNTIGIWHAGDKKLTYYNVKNKIDFGSIKAIRNAEKREKTLAKLEEKNGTSISDCLDAIIYHDGALTINLKDIIFDHRMEIQASALVQNLTLSYTVNTLDLIEINSLSKYYHGDETVMIQIPQDRLYEDIKVTFVIDDVAFTRDDLIRLLPDDLIRKNRLTKLQEEGREP